MQLSCLRYQAHNSQSLVITLATYPTESLLTPLWWPLAPACPFLAFVLLGFPLITSSSFVIGQSCCCVRQAVPWLPACSAIEVTSLEYLLPLLSLAEVLFLNSFFGWLACWLINLR